MLEWRGGTFDPAAFNLDAVKRDPAPVQAVSVKTASG